MHPVINPGNNKTEIINNEKIEYKKELAISKLSELANNKIISEQANTLIESDVYEVKKLLQKNNITK